MIALSFALLAASGSSASPSALPIPANASDTKSAPVERIFREWLSVFNSNSVPTIKAFYAKYLDDPNPAFVIESAQDSCGLTVERVVDQTPTSMTVLLRQRCLQGLQRVKIEMASAEASKLKSLDIVPLALLGDQSISTIAQITNRLAARNDFAGSLIVVQNGKRMLARSWGRVDPKLKAQMTLDTPMFLASAGKMFTGVATLQLVEAGKIDLDAPMGRYLIDYPNAEMAKVTIRQLLTHRGGTGDIGILGRDDGANRARVRIIADIVKLNGSRAPDFPPGTKDEYSNYGFILLGAVIEKVTGSSYYDYIAEHVFKPAGMKNSGFPDHDHLDGIGVGYTTFYGAKTKLVSNIDVLPWRGASAGGGVASANDMVRFFDALNAGKLLSPAMLKLATTPGATSWYGMGFVAQNRDRIQYGHGGNSYGMDVAAHTYPDNKLTVVCMGARDMVCNRIFTSWYFRKFGPWD